MKCGKGGDKNQRGHKDVEKGRYVWRWESIRKIREKEPLKVK